MPNIKKNIFNRKKLNYLLSRVAETSIPDLNAKLEIIGNWKNFIRSGNIFDTKETALQGNFLTDIFSGVLGYKSRIKSYDEWNLNQEQLTAIDSKFADGSLGYFSKDREDVKAVIELKDANTNLDERQHRHNDTRTPVEQAFSYQHKTGKSCKWVIVSNFREIRLYHHSSSTEYEVFFIEELDSFDTFKRFYFLLNCSNLINKIGASEIDSLYATNEAEEQNISKEFYSAFKQARLKLFNHIKANNPEKPELLLLEKTQKLLDRFIFICFCEDNRLLPDKTYRRIVETANKSFSFSETKIWTELKGLFHAINSGSPPHNINKFNGGLFAADSELDSLIIKDSALAELQPITDYDFESDVDVNILGHIFEQSISDIEEIKSGIEGKDYDKKTSKRKKDGIYYTPEYITKYIVENAVSGWLEDRKKELGFYELPELSESDLQTVKIVKGKPSFNENVRKHFDFWTAFKERLMNIKVIDPACGSGAFLNQAFNYLFAEGQKVNDTLARLTLGQGELFELDKHILSNNLYGVDLNNESVEITRLSLWLKTANKHSELTALDKNIKCGNSLIDDPAVAGEKAFDWNKEFPEIMQSGGFDVVIGNPPYGIILDKEQEQYYKSNYPLTNYKINLYLLFIERMVGLFNKAIIHFIIPKSLLFNVFYSKIREYLLRNTAIEEVFTLEEKVFTDAEVGDSLLIKIVLGRSLESHKIKAIAASRFSEYVINPTSYTNIVSQSYYLSMPNMEISVINNSSESIINKITNFDPIRKYYNLKNGLNPGNIKHVLIKNYNANENCKRIIWGKDISPYVVNWSGDYVEYDSEIGSRITLDDTISKSGMRKQERIDFALRSKDIFETPKIVVRKTGDSLIASFDDKNYYFDTLVNGIYSNNSIDELYFLLGILNSRPATTFYRMLHDIEGKVFAKITLEQLSQFPIPFEKKSEEFILLVRHLCSDKNQFNLLSNEFITFTINKFGIKPNSAIKKWHELKFSDFLTELLKAKVKIPLEEQLAWQSLFENQKAKVLELKSKIAETDRMIDSMVYELYGLTVEEIRIIEGV